MAMPINEMDNDMLKGMLSFLLEERIGLQYMALLEKTVERMTDALMPDGDAYEKLHQHPSPDGKFSIQPNAIVVQYFDYIDTPEGKREVSVDPSEWFVESLQNRTDPAITQSIAAYMALYILIRLKLANLPMTSIDIDKSIIHDMAHNLEFTVTRDTDGIHTTFIGVRE